MSSPRGGSVGQTRNWSAMLWVPILAISLVVFGLNFAFQQLYSSQESNARGIAADISVKSQQLAAMARDAVAGDQNAFAKFKAARAAIETDIHALQDGSVAVGVPSLRDALGIGGPLQALADTWAPIASNADLIIRNQAQILSVTHDPGLFAAAHDAEKQISDDSSQLLADSRTLGKSFDTLSVRRLFPSIYVGGCLGSADAIQPVWSGTHLASGSTRRTSEIRGWVLIEEAAPDPATRTVVPSSCRWGEASGTHAHSNVPDFI